jgi:hypothetical protein
MSSAKSKVPSARLVFVILVAIGLGWWFWGRSDPRGNALEARRLATRGLAQYLAQRFASQQAVVLSNPFTQMPGVSSDIRAPEEAGLEGLRDGFADKISIAAVAFPELRPEAQQNPRGLLGETETTTPLSYLVTAEAFDKVWRQHGDPPLVVSLIGLPVELDKCGIWNAPAPPRFALLWPDLRVVGESAQVQQAFRSGKLAAFVARKPGAPPDGVSLGRDLKAEFERRFVLVTAENFEAVRGQYPGLY